MKFSNQRDVDLVGLPVFARAAELRSFAAAARELGLTPSAVGKSVARLESTLGVRLIVRSTRRLQLTDEGQRFFARCRALLDDLADAQAEVRRAAAEVQGTLRISAPAQGYRLLAPLLAGFRRAHPALSLELDFSDRHVDLIDEGYDAVLRGVIGDTPSDTGLSARRLWPFRFVLCASPSCVEAAGGLPDLRALATAPALHYRVARTGRLQPWDLPQGVEPPASLVCNSVEALLAACRAGAGVACLPDFVAQDALRRADLVEVLPGASARRGDLWLLWPASRRVTSRLRVFIDTLVAAAAPSIGAADGASRSG